MRKKYMSIAADCIVSLWHDTTSARLDTMRMKSIAKRKSAATLPCGQSP